MFYITPEKIDGCNHFDKKTNLDDRMDGSGWSSSLRKATTVKKMNDRSLFFSINEHYFKKWTTGRGVLKKI